MIRRTACRLFTALPLVLGAAALSPDAEGQDVTSEGWAEASAGLTFYLEVPMIDNYDLEDYGIGGNITAESIINAVRYAADHPDIRHVAFKMNTGGGALHHAEAMEDIIERHHDNTEFHIVVQDAISAGIWTAFSCDTIFMCRDGTIGGATAYYQLSADLVLVAGDIPEIAARLALTAERNGYPPQLIEPLMLMKTELHYWIDEDGEKVLSNTAPEDKEYLEGYRHLDRKDTVLTLTSQDAIEIGIAKPIGGFDTQLVGEEIGVPGWTRANRFGTVNDEIGMLYNTTRRMEDVWVERQLNLRRFPVTTYNRNNRMIKDMLRDRRQHADIVEALRTINKALNALPEVHPERHIYVMGEDKQTILADPEQWSKDVTASRGHASRLTQGLRQLKDGFKKQEIDANNLDDIESGLTTIAQRIQEIARQGNAAYWDKQRD